MRTSANALPGTRYQSLFHPPEQLPAQGTQTSSAWGLILANTKTKSRHTRSDNQGSAQPAVGKNTPLPAGRRCDNGFLPVHSEGVLPLDVCRWINKGGRKPRLLPESHWACSTCGALLASERVVLLSSMRWGWGGWDLSLEVR